MQPNAATQMTSARAPRTAESTAGVIRLVSSTGMPNLTAQALTGDGSSSLPRERTASGLVTTSTTSFSQARRSSDGTANSGVPMTESGRETPMA